MQTRRTIVLEPEPSLHRVLKEVSELLEAYAPAWYQETLSKRIEAALNQTGMTFPQANRS